MKGDLARIVTRLRQEPEKYVIVDAGPSLVQEFIQRGLADDYCIFVMPIIFGRGKKLYWGPMLKQAESDASVGQESQPWRAGVALRDGSIGKAVLVRELSMILTPHPERYSS